MKKLVFSLALSLAAIFSINCSADESQPRVILKTNHGDIVLELNPKAAPVSVKNFLQYVEDGYYSGTIFHRIIKDFMIQGGGFSQDFQKKQTRAPIKNEAENGLKNVPGSVAMARTNDPDSATSQFFINLRNNLRLDWAGGRDGYTVFGEVIEGMSVVDYIATAPTTKKGGMGDVPETPIMILEVARKSLL